MRLEPANETQMRQGIFLWFFGSKGHMDVVSMIKNEIRREILVLQPKNSQKHSTIAEKLGYLKKI